MRRWLRHPGLRRLSALADDACNRQQAAAIREHLAECARCRRELAFILELRKASRELPAPRPPAGLKEEILTRWEAGERSILPLHDPPPPRERPGMAGLLGLSAGLLMAVALVVFLLTGEAAAGASQLRLAPDLLRPGEALDVEYTTPSELAGEERLRLRARYRVADDPPPRSGLGRSEDTELARVRAGRFRGSLWLPDAAVYAAFSVEDLAGERVDANGGRLWEILARDATGRPTFEGLVQRMRALETVRWAEALETARRATELYPVRIQGWAHRLLYEGLLLDGERRDSLFDDHRRRFGAFERELAAAGQPEGEEMAALLDYARALGDAEAVARWTTRLAEASPRHRLVVQERVAEAIRGYAGDPETQAGMLEEEWERSGPADESLLATGFQAALRWGAPDPILEWAERIERYAPHLASWAATSMAAVPELREEAIARLGRELDRLEAVGPEARPLDRSAAEQRAANRQRAARLLATLGRALAAEGQGSAAREALERAAEYGWDAALLHELAELHLTMGDTVTVVRLLARAASDPLGPPDAASPAHPVAADLDGAEWERLVAEERAELRRRVMERAERREIPSEVRVVDAAGERRPLRELVDAGPTFLVFWSHHSYPALRALPLLREWAPRLASAGIALAVVVEGEHSPEAEEALRRAGVRAPVFFDANHEMAVALDLWDTPRYLVSDAGGLIRARYREIEEGLRLALVLARERAPAE